MVTIDEVKCTGCGLCIGVCPVRLIAPGPTLDPHRASHCLECGHCFAICPEGAITVLGFEGLETEPLPDEPPVSPWALRSLLRRRRSGRAYSDRPVARQHLEGLIEAASLAPSAHNGRPLRAHVCADSAAVDRVRQETQAYYRQLLRKLRSPYGRLLWCLRGQPPDKFDVMVAMLEVIANAEGASDPLLYHAPVVLAFSAPKADPMTVADGWLAAQNATLYAETVPLATCYNGFIVMAARDWAPLRTALGLEPGHQVIATIMLGYPARTYRRSAPRRTMPTTWL